jgi:uncharacterized protein (DUF1330 family)
MKTKYKLALTLFSSVTLGAAAIQILHAQSKPMGYIIAQHTVNDQERFAKEFAPSIAKTIQDAGGKFLVRGGKTISIHGVPPSLRVVVIQFESVERAEAWAHSPATKAAFAIGEKYATLNDFTVEGVSP